MEHSFEIDMVESKVDTYAELIDQHVYDDTKQLYSYNQFLNELEQVEDSFTIRINFILNNYEVNRDDLNIDEVVYSIDGVNFA